MHPRFGLGRFYVSHLRSAIRKSVEGLWSSGEVVLYPQIIHDIAKEEPIKLDPAKIHRASDEKIRLLRRAAFSFAQGGILANSSDASETVNLILTRATSYWAHGKEESLSIPNLKQVSPELIATIVDDPIAIYDRIPLREETKKYADLEIDDIVRWMEQEVSTIEQLAHDLDCPLYVIPNRQVGALVELVMFKKPAAYLSYPMSLATEDTRERKDALLHKLKDHFVVFDPECMGTAHTMARMTDKEQNSYRSDVILRDEEWFVRINSEYVIGYLPERVPAHGSQSELNAASEQQKTVWVILEPGYCDFRGTLTPFIDQGADLVFISSQEFEYYLGLEKVEREAYARIMRTMWGFKRNGEFEPLVNGGDGKEESVRAKFKSAASKDYQHGVARAQLKLLGDETIEKIINASWDFNSSVWQSTPQAKPALQLVAPPQESLLFRAARHSPQGVLPADSSEPPTSAPPRNEPDLDKALSDEDVFFAVFRGLALSRVGQRNLDTVKRFFSDNHLGSFSHWIHFLRDIKRRLELEKQPARRLLDAEELAVWLRESDG